jgi:hypothetical protein
MEDKITIIEGPPPIFESVNDGWALGLNESPWLYDLTYTQVRTYNGPALVERCHRAWKQGDAIYLHYRDEMGMEEKAPILAARSITAEDGQVLILWVRLMPEVSEAEMEDGDEIGDEDQDEEEGGDVFEGDEEDEEDEDEGGDSDVMDADDADDDPQAE